MTCFNCGNMKWIACILLSIVLLLSGSISLQAQSVDKYDAFMAVNDDEVSLTELRDAGLTITARYNGIITAQVPNTYKPYDLKSFSGVVHVTPAIPLVTYSDSARYYSRVDAVHEGTGFDMPYTGKGIIVGVIDCGFDFSHINFWDDEGNTRVKAVYMPFNDTGKTTIINRIQLPGTCFERPETINPLTTDDPMTTHGTQTAGIAAGSYRGNGWHGMAPDADLVVCGMPEGELNDVRVAHCISYIDDYAKRMGKPYVVNLSIGCNIGAHDGSSFLSKVFQQHAGPGHVFVVAAGNDGDEPVCIHESIPTRQDTVSVLLSGYNGGMKRAGCVNAWSSDGKPFNTRLIVVDTRNGNIVYKSRSLGSTTVGVTAEIDSETDTLLAQYYTGKASFSGTIESNGNGSSLMSIDLTANASNYAMGFQYYGAVLNHLDIWTSQYAYFNNYGLPWVSKGTPQGSINDLATTDSVISVGSYNTKQYVPLRDGTEYYRYFSKPFEISYYSSYGPDQNGISRPDVCAPGSVVISSANRYDTAAPNLEYWQPSVFVDGVEYPYCPDLGTSMSAPVVTGTIALWMQANPNLSVNDVREVLRHSCYKDGQVMSGNRDRWGFGKLDARAGLRYVIYGDDKVGDVNLDGEINLSDVNAVIDIILGGKTDDDTRSRADVNKDGEISVSDINMILDIIMS